MPSVTGSFPSTTNRCALLCFRTSLFSTPSAKLSPRLPIDSTCVRLKKVLSLSFLSFLRLFVRFVSFYLSTFPLRPLVRPLAFPALRRKVSRDFFVPFLSPNPAASALDTTISVSQYSACAIVFLETAG